MIYRGFEIRKVSNGYIAVGDVNTLGGYNGELLSEEHAMEAVDRFKKNPVYGDDRKGLNDDR